MGMSNYILGNVDKFWDIAEETASKSTTFAEFSNAMDKHADLLQGSGESNCDCRRVILIGQIKVDK